MAGAIFQDILIFFRPRLDFYRGDFRGLGGESPVATVYFFCCLDVFPFVLLHTTCITALLSLVHSPLLRFAFALFLSSAMLKV